MALTPGTRIGSYEIATQIGVGGMGEVYRATDTRLKRDVAIKVLPDMFAGDAERLARLQREAEVLAALNHPGIAHIYGIEEVGGSTALVMELVEGPTLADRISQGALPVDEALAVARQIAGALEAAHGRGIVHRDLKPANVKVKPDGTVKVLDFGLAKAVAPGATQGSSEQPTAFSQSPTITTPAMTRAGVILGTAAYMSPEQAKGLPVDKRGDVWAFGAVLYEMLTGRRAFEGADVSEVFAAVIKLEPDWTALPELPPLVASFLKQALRKSPAERLADMQDMRLALEGAFEEVRPAPVEADLARRSWQHSLAVAMSSLVVGGALASAVAWVSWPSPGTRVQRLTLGFADGFPVARHNTYAAIDVSPDGRRVAYVADRGGEPTLAVREMDDLEPVPVYEGNFATPVFGPDNAWVAFDDRASNRIMKVSADARRLVRVTELPGPLRGMDWGADGRIVVGTGLSTGLWVVPDSGGDLEELTTLDTERGDRNHVLPRWLPGGDALLFTIEGSDRGHSIAVADLLRHTTRVLIDNGSYPLYSPTGHIVFTANGTLRAVPFDARSLLLTGSEFALPDAVRTMQNGVADVAMADDGNIVYLSEAEDEGLRSLVWVDSSGEEQPVPTLVGPYEWVSLSRDGTQALLGVRRDRPYMEVADLERGRSRRLPIDSYILGPAVWETDETMLVTLRGERSGVYEYPIDRAGEPRLLLEGMPERLLLEGMPEGPMVSVQALAPDGVTLILQAIVTAQGGGQMPQLVVARTDDPAAAEPLVEGSASVSAALSPSGRLVAYSITGRNRDTTLIMEPFPDGGRTVTVGLGAFPKWSDDGRTLSYMRIGPGNAAMMRVEVTGEASGPFDIGAESELFPFRYYRTDETMGFFDMTRDGSRFLVLKPYDGEERSAPRGIVVQGFAAELRSLAPSEASR